MRLVFRVVLGVLCVLAAATADAQVVNGSITGTVSDTGGGVLPGVNVTLTGDRLIGGSETQITDPTGTYRFDRLSPGTYTVKFELQGFKGILREGIVNAAFVATINVKLEVGSVSESITVTGESPTVDTKSNVQQTVMSQELLEGGQGRNAGDAQLRGQGAGRRKALPRRQAAGDDGVAIPLVDLAMQGPWRTPVHGHHGQDPGSAFHLGIIMVGNSASKWLLRRPFRMSTLRP